MNNAQRSTFALAALLLVGGTAIIVQAQDAKSEAKPSLPAAVEATVKAVIPGGTIIESYKEDEDGTEVWEVEVKSADGIESELTILPDGRLMEMEQELTEANLPADVAKTMKALCPGGKTMEIEKKTVVIYAIEKEVEGQLIEMEFDPSGKLQWLEMEPKHGADEDDGEGDEEENQD